MPMWRVVTRIEVFKSEIFLKSCSLITKMPFYAVAKGRTSGIFMTWPDCETQVKGFPGARYKKFDTVVGAQDFITSNGGATVTKAKPSKNSTNSFSVTTNNLSKSFPTSSNSQIKVVSEPTKRKSNIVPKDETFEDSGEDDRFSDDSDDLNAVLSKQMDDIEKRLKTFEKGVDKIIKKGTKKAILIEPSQNKRRKTSGSEFEVDNEGFVHVYTDGACSSNGKSCARAGLGVYWGDDHPLNVSEPVSGRATNNSGEIQAATRAIKQAVQNKIQKLTINTDSKFLINSVTKWIPGWKRNGWQLKSGQPVKNEKDFKDLDSVQHKLQIKWNYVEAHRGIHANEMADRLAKAGATRYENKKTEYDNSIDTSIVY